MEKIHNASLRIAAALGHAWARHATAGEDGFIQFDEVAAKKASAEDQFGGNYTPENSGFSGTGRIRWGVHPQKDGTATVCIQICRPGSLVGSLGSVCVIECQFTVDTHGEWLWDQPYRLEGCKHAEDRHWITLDMVLDAFGLQSDSVVNGQSHLVLAPQQADADDV